MATTNCSALPNPETPLAFLPPNIASELEVSRYIYVASLGALIWDLLSNVPSDYKLLFKYRVTLPTIIYFLSRIASLAYVISSTVFQIGAVGNCQALQVALGICFAVAVPATSLLFFMRVRAIFNGEKIVVGIFGFLWLAVLGGCITVPFAINGGHIGPTTHCVNTGVKPFSSAGIVISAVNDTLVLFAISLRILYNASVDNNVGARVKTFWNGGALPSLSKSVLQSGQQYYLITVGGNILTMVMILTPSVTPVYRAMFTIPNVVIENSMACKVYRDIKFGLIEQTSTSTFQQSSSRKWNSSAFNRYAQRPGRAAGFHGGNVSEGITVSKTIERTTDGCPVELSFVPHASSRPSISSDHKGGGHLGSINV